MGIDKRTFMRYTIQHREVNMVVYNELVKAQTNGRKCNHCEESIDRGRYYLHMARNRHTYVLCRKCLVMFATQAYKADSLFKAEATGELL